MTKLNEKALLCQLNVSQWLGRKFDRKATQDVANLNNTSSKAGRYNKLLLPMSDSLTDIHKGTTSIRHKFYENTLHWDGEGQNLLPTKNYLDYMSLFRQQKTDWFALVDKFLQEYPQLQTNASRMLGDLYNASDYPSVSELRSKFSMDMVVMPVPSDDFRVDVNDKEMQIIQQDVGTRVANASDSAMQEAWQRLYDKVKHIADKLSDPKSVFRDTMINNLTDICNVLKNLNIHDDPNLENLRQEVQQSFANEIPESLRNDPHLRNRKADEASAIMKKMNVYMGGSSE